MRHIRSPYAVALVLIVAVAIVLRLANMRQSLFADELATYWVVDKHSFAGVLSTVGSDAEISPPLPFLLAKLASEFGPQPGLLRLPSLVAGVATIPLVAVLGTQLKGPRVGVLSATFVAASPFLIYYSTEARSYALVIALTCASTSVLLVALDRGQKRWWLAYAILLALSMYAHYVAVYVLIAQSGWALLTHRRSIRAMTTSCGVATIFYLPWVPWFLADLSSPTSRILAALSPLTPRALASNSAHWALGNPYSAISLSAVPGLMALVLIGVGAAVALLGMSSAVRDDRAKTMLIVLLAVSTPVGTLLQSIVGSSIFSMRNLSPSWPGLALAVATAALSAPFGFRLVAVSSLVLGTGLAGAKTLNPHNQRARVGQAVAYIVAHLRSGDVSIDATGDLSPGPLTAFDSEWAGRNGQVIRANAPEERSRPFQIGDTSLTPQQAIDRAVAEGHTRIFVTLLTLNGMAVGEEALNAVHAHVPSGYRVVGGRSWPSRLAGPTVVILQRPG